MSTAAMDAVQLNDRDYRTKQRIPDRRRTNTACGRSSACGGRSLLFTRIDALSPADHGPCQHH